MSTLATSTSASPGADLAALRASYRSTLEPAAGQPAVEVEAAPTPAPRRSIVGAIKRGIDRFDEVVADHPKTAVTVAALAGGAAGVVHANQPRGNALTNFVSKTSATLGGAVVTGLGIEAVLAECPNILQHLTSALQATPGHVEATVVGTVIAVGALIGRALASRGSDTRQADNSASTAEPKRSLPERLPGMIARTVLPFSGTIAGGAIGIGVAALLGPLTAVPVTIAAVSGAFAGTALGPVVVPGGLSSRWWKAFIYSLIPLGALIGHHLGGGDMGRTFQGAVYGAFGTAAGTKGMAHDILFR